MKAIITWFKLSVFDGSGAKKLGLQVGIDVLPQARKILPCT
jgi:hypothetical protein